MPSRGKVGNERSSSNKGGDPSIRHCSYCKEAAAAYWKTHNSFRKAWFYWQQGISHLSVHEEMVRTLQVREGNEPPPQRRLPGV